MSTQDMTITVDGASMPCYLARPDGEAPRPAVIVFQEIFGVNAEVKRIADLFATAGYVALAPNYYYRTHPNLNEPYTSEGLQAGFAAAGRVTHANLRADTSAAIAYLNEQSFVKQDAIATVGFCFGGTVAFVTATLDGLRAAIPFYGGQIAQPLLDGEPEALAELAAIKVPLLLFFGGKDDYISAEHVAKIESALSAAGKTFEIVSYPNVGHAFFRDSSAKMDEHEIGDAWSRVKRFLEHHLA